jgi:uncharacterized protein YukE
MKPCARPGLRGHDPDVAVRTPTIGGQSSSRAARFLLLGVACSPGFGCSWAAADTSLDRAEARLAEHRQVYMATAVDIEYVRLTARVLSEQAEGALQILHDVTREYARAKGLYGSASAEYQSAAASWRAAATAYRAAATVLIVAATTHFLLHDLCGPAVSTRQHRAMLEERGVDTWGRDIDHIISRAHGGPNRPWNYQPLDSSINRSLGAGGLGWKLAHMPLATLTALTKTIAYHLMCHA